MHTDIGWHDARCVMEVMSIADGLLRKPNGGSCTIEFKQRFSTCFRMKNSYNAWVLSVSTHMMK